MPDPKDPNVPRDRDLHSNVVVGVDDRRAAKIINRTRNLLHEVFDPTYSIKFDAEKPHRALDELRAKVITTLHQIEGIPKEVGDKIQGNMREAANQVLKAGKITDKTFRILQDVASQMAQIRSKVEPDQQEHIHEIVNTIYDSMVELLSGTAHDMSERLSKAMADLPVGIDAKYIDEAREQAHGLQESLAQFYAGFKKDMDDFKTRYLDALQRMSQGEDVEIPNLFDTIIERQKEFNRLQKEQEKVLKDTVERAKDLARAEEAWKDFWREILPGGMHEDRLQMMRPKLPREALSKTFKELEQEGVKIGRITKGAARVMGFFAPYMEKFDLLHMGPQGIEMGSALGKVPGIGGAIMGTVATTGGLYALILGAFLGLVKALLSLSDTMAEFNGKVLEATAGVTRLSQVAVGYGRISPEFGVREAYTKIFDQTNSIFNMFIMTQEEILDAVSSLQAAGDNLESITAGASMEPGKFQRTAAFGGAKNAMQEMAFVVKTYSTLLGQTVQETGQMLAEFHDQLLIPFSDLDSVMADVTDDMYSSAMGANRFFSALREITNVQRLYNANLRTTSKLLSTLGRSLTASAQDAADLAATFSTAITNMDASQRAALMRFGGITSQTFRMARASMNDQIEKLEQQIQEINQAIDEASTYEEKIRLRGQRNQVQGRLIELRRRASMLESRGYFDRVKNLQYLPQETQMVGLLRAITESRGDTKLTAALQKLNKGVVREKAVGLYGQTEASLAQLQHTLMGLPQAYITQLENVTDKINAGKESPRDREFLQRMEKIFGTQADLIGDKIDPEPLITAIKNMTLEQMAKLATLIPPPSERKASDARREAAAMVQETISIQKMLETTIGGILKWIGGMVADIRKILYKIFSKFFGSDISAFGDFSASMDNFMRYSRMASVEVTKKIDELKKRMETASPEERKQILQQISTLDKAYQELIKSSEDLNRVYADVQTGKIKDPAILRSYQMAMDTALDNFKTILEQEGKVSEKTRKDMSQYVNVSDRMQEMYTRSYFPTQTVSDIGRSMLLNSGNSILQTAGLSFMLSSVFSKYINPAENAVPNMPKKTVPPPSSPIINNYVTIERAMLSPQETQAAASQTLRSLDMVARSGNSP